MNITQSLEFIRPSEQGMSIDEFTTIMDNLTVLSLNGDKTLVRRTKEQLKKYYEHTLFLELDGNIIGKSSILPTDKFTTPIDIDDQKIHIGETTGTLILPEYRNQGYGNVLVEKAEEMIGSGYDIILGGTINDLMVTIRTNKGYEVVDFPPALYEEGKSFFAPLLDGGVEEFAQRAKCLIKFKKDIDEETKNKFLLLFSTI